MERSDRSMIAALTEQAGSYRTSNLRFYSPRSAYIFAWLSLIAVAVVPRLLHLTDSLWYDEATSTLKLRLSLGGLAWIFYDTHPPLYNALTLLWNQLFGESELSLRALPFLCGIASVLAIGKLVREIAGERARTLASVLLALSGAAVFYAQEARSYSLIILLFLLMGLALLRYGRTARPHDFGWFVVASFLCSITHIYAAIFVICLTITMIFVAADRRTVPLLLRLMALQLVLLVPFYFHIAALRFFTNEAVYAGTPDRLTGLEVVSLPSFCLFGYSDFASSWLIRLAAVMLFLFGLAVSLRWTRHTHFQLHSDRGLRHTFSFPGIEPLFIAAAGAGLVISAVLAALRWIVRPDLVAVLIPNNEHQQLLRQMIDVISRTAVLYFAGYGVAVAVWITAKRLALKLSAARPVDEPELRGRFGNWIRVLLVFPLVGLAPVAVLSYGSSGYNVRYMLPLMPFLLLPMALMLARIPRRLTRQVAIAGVAVLQVFGLIRQERVFNYYKPDYRAVVRYLSSAGRLHIPIAATAFSHEPLNVTKYYCRRLALSDLHLVPISDIATLPSVSLIVPDRYPAGHDRAADIQRWTSGLASVNRIDFPGVSVYELNRGTPIALSQPHMAGSE